MTIDTSRAAVERILEGVTPGPWGCSMGKLVRIVKVVSRSPIVLAGVHRFGRNGGKATDGDCEANGRFIAAARDLVPALLARAEAAEAEVARLSAPPDDAEVLAIIKDVTFEAVNSEIDRVLAGRICQKLARLSHALAARRKE